MDPPLQQQVVRPKKRISQPEFWRRNAIKILKLRGLQHHTHWGNEIIPAREVVEEACRHNCHLKLNLEEKEWILNRFNSYPSHESQNIYLQSCTVPLQNRRFDYIFQLPHRIEVACQKTFLNVHGIRRSRLQRKVLRRDVPIRDGRGKHGRHHIVDPALLQTVRTFIENLESRNSHYSLNNNRNKVYLESHSTMRSLYNILITENPRLNPALHADGVKESKFVQIFNYEYNIGLGFPRSDICDKCEILQAKITAASVENDQDLEFQLRLEQQEHLSEAEIFYDKMSRNTINATDNTHIYLCFDYQKNLPFPVTNVSKEFFLRQLWMYNFGIRNLRTGETHMFSYCEHYGMKGSSEVLSFLKFYIENVVPQCVRHLHLFSDNSYGQNKNRFLMAYLQSICPGRFDTIEFDFPSPGHSRMTIDADFAQVEKKKRREDKILYPSQWIDLMRSARPSAPFTVIYVNYPVTNDMCNDGSQICNIRSYKLSMTPLIRPSAGQIAEIRGLLYSENGVFSRNTLSGETTNPLQLLRPAFTVANLQQIIATTPLAYNGYLPISPVKLSNIETLLETFHQRSENVFYDTILNTPFDGDDTRFAIINEFPDENFDFGFLD